MSTYIFKYSKGLIKRKIKAIGHKFYSDIDRMDIFHENGSITSIGEWSKYTLWLGTDWVLFTKKQMEKESGQRVELTVGES